jgi:hypothetical protein
LCYFIVAVAIELKNPYGNSATGFVVIFFLILYMGFTGARTRNKDRMGFFSAASLIIGLSFITEMFGNIAYYLPLCGAWHQLSDKVEAAGGSAADIEAAAETAGIADNCISYYGFQITAGLCCVLFFVASRKGYLLYKSRIFSQDESDQMMMNFQDQMMLNSAPRAQGYNASLAQAASALPYEPPRA